MEIEGAKYSYSDENIIIGIFLEQKNECDPFFTLKIVDDFEDTEIFDEIYTYIEKNMTKYDAILQIYKVYLINTENISNNIKTLLNKHFLKYNK